MFEKEEKIFMKVNLSNIVYAIIKLILNSSILDQLIFYQIIINSNRMSFQKKSIILQELEQAIRKKAQQKSRHKEQANRVLQSSVEKKKIIKSSVNPNKEVRISSISKQSEPMIKQNQRNIDKPISLFNNQQLMTGDGNDLKFKKYNNRRLDKLVSLILYMISSSQKALKYISSTNFEAEFAIKLFRSDKQNLVNQLKNLNLEDILDSQRSHQMISYKPDLQLNSLLQENSKLKKDIIILQKEAQRFHKQGNVISEPQPSWTKSQQKQNSKLKQVLRKIIPFDSFKQIIDILEKESKFQSMSIKCQENSKKITQIQIVINSLQNERNAILQNFIRSTKTELKSQKSFRLSQFQQQKQQLQRQIINLKNKLAELKQSSKSVNQSQLLKKNTQLINQKLNSLANQLNINIGASSKGSSQQMIDKIKAVVFESVKSNKQLNDKRQFLIKQNQELKRQNIEFRKYKKQSEEEFNQSDKKLQHMMNQIGKFKDAVDELQSDRCVMLEQIQELESNLKFKQNQIQVLNMRLGEVGQKEREREQLRFKNNQLKKENQSISKKYDDKQRFYRQKIDKLLEGKTNLEDKVMEMAEQLQHQRNQLLDLAKRNQELEDSRDLVVQKMKINYLGKQEDYTHQINQAETELQQHRAQYQRLRQTHQKLFKDVVELTESNNTKNKIIAQLQTQLQNNQEQKNQLQRQFNKQKNKSNSYEDSLQLRKQLNQLKLQLQRVKKQNSTITQKLRTTQHQIISNNYANQELQTKIEQNSMLMQKIINLQQAIATQNKTNNKDDQLVNKLNTELKLKAKECLQLSQSSQLLKTKLQSQSIQINNLNSIIKQQTSKIQSINANYKLLEQKIKNQNQIFADNNRQQQTVIGQLEQKKEELEEQNMKAIQKIQQYTTLLDAQRRNNEALQEQINNLQKDMIQLQNQIISVNAMSKDVLNDRDTQKQILNCLESQKQQLQNQINTTKQAIQENNELNKFKTKQYVNLLKQILKGLDVDLSQLDSSITFEQLLEFGSQAVLQMRKRQREEESNRRKNYKQDKDYYDYDSGKDYALSGKQHQQLQECKVNLFSYQPVTENKQGHADAPIQNEQAQHIQQQQQIEAFQNLQQSSMNDSMLSHENKLVQPLDENIQQKKQADLQEFNDLPSENVNDSVLSNVPFQNQQNNLEQPHHIPLQSDIKNSAKNEQSNNQQQIQNNIQPDSNVIPKNQADYDEFKDMTDNNMGQSFLSVNKAEEDKNIPIEHYPQHMNYQQISEIHHNNQQRNSINSQNDNFLEKNFSNLQQFQNIEEQQNQSVSSVKPEEKMAGKDIQEFNDLQDNEVNNSVMSEAGNKLKDFDIKKLDQFEQVKSDQMNQSVVSQYNIKKNNSQEIIQNPSSAEKEQSKKKNQHYPEQKANQSNEGANFDAFGEIDGNQMNDSMLSQKQHGLSQFQEIQQNKANDSVISNKHELSQFQEIEGNKANDSVISNKQHELSQFQQIQQNKVNDSVLSEKQHGLSEFGQYNDEKINESLLSEKQHGLSQFGQVPEDKMNDSIISGKNSKNKEEGNNFQQFQEYKSDKMNDSVISQKFSPTLQHAKSNENIHLADHLSRDSL